MDFSTSMSVAASGMRVQSERMKVIAENIANADSTSPTPGGDPYRRKVPTVTTSFDRELGASVVESGKTIEDQSAFRRKYDPGNPDADKQGYVKLPNVDPMLEIMDMREAQRSYQADLTIMTATKQMLSNTIGLLNK